MVRPWVKIFGITLAVLGIAFMLIKMGGGKVELPGENKEVTQAVDKEKSSNFLSNLFTNKSGSKDYITIGVDTYGGHAPIVYLNGGMEPNENSEIYKRFGIKLKFEIVENDREAFKAGLIDVIFGTIDVRPIEMGEGSVMLDTRAFVDANRSRGADALVVDATINSVADLLKKKVAFPLGQAGHSLLLEVLATSGAKGNDVTLAEWFVDGKLTKVDNGMDAAEVMKSRQANAALVYSPDDVDLVKNIPGAKVFFSTKQAPNLIVDAYLAKESYIEKNREKIVKLTEAILYANVELATNDVFLKGAAETFAKGFGVDKEFICELDNNGKIVSSIRDVLRFSTLGDNINFFGLNPNYNGITYEQLYSRMARIYSSEEVGMVKSPVRWGRTMDASIIEYLMDNHKLTNDQSAEKDRSYVAPTAREIAAPALSNKKVVIEFATNSAILNSDAQYIIDSEFVEIAKNFTNYIRVEGNTDNTGSAELNRDLSKRRAQSVVDYLVKQHGFPKTRFIVEGNGSKHAIAAGSVGPDKNYRTTDFQLVAE